MFGLDLVHSFSFKQSIAPGVELSGTTPVAGEWVDASATIGPVVGVVNFNAATGTPDAQAHAVKIREADTSGGSGAADIADATVTVTADGAVAVIQARNRSKRYVQVYVTPAFTGGTTPKNKVGALIFAQNERY